MNCYIQVQVQLMSFTFRFRKLITLSEMVSVEHTCVFSSHRINDFLPLLCIFLMGENATFAKVGDILDAVSCRFCAAAFHYRGCNNRSYRCGNAAAYGKFMIRHDVACGKLMFRNAAMCRNLMVRRAAALDNITAIQDLANEQILVGQSIPHHRLSILRCDE